MYVSCCAEESWRNRLVGIDRENAELRQRLNQLEGAVSTRDTDVGKLQKRIQALEKANETLQRALSTMELNKKDLEREVMFLYYYCDQENIFAFSSSS